MTSVLVPLYNGVEFIDESVTSILNQTFTLFEIIIGVNGYHKDSSLYESLVSKYKDNTKIRVIDYYYVHGKAEALNEMVFDSVYPYVALLDVDDIWLPTKLEKQVPLLSKYDIIGTCGNYFGNWSTQIDIPEGEIDHDSIMQNSPIINSSMLMKKKDAWWRFPFGRHIDDYDMWLRLFKEGKKMYNIPETLVKHRIHDSFFFEKNASTENNVFTIADNWNHRNGHNTHYVTINIQGGLGNQLYQLATALAYSIEHGHQLSLIFIEQSPSVFDDRNTHWKTILSKFKEIKENTPENFEKVYETKQYEKISYYENNVCLDGYFQSYRYFHSHLPRIYPYFTKDLYKYRSIYLGDYTTVGIHVRRGDYLKLQDYHPVQPIEYYQKAIGYINQKIGTNTKYIIVSDDIEWCKVHFDWLDYVTYSRGVSTEEDFSNLFFCDHFVCANSTFSWWAAYLRWYYKRDSIVVVPDNWSHEFDNKWRFPGEWVIL